MINVYVGGGQGGEGRALHRKNITPYILKKSKLMKKYASYSLFREALLHALSLVLDSVPAV